MGHPGLGGAIGGALLSQPSVSSLNAFGRIRHLGRIDAKPVRIANLPDVTPSEVTE